MLMKCKDTGFILAVVGCFEMYGESDSCDCHIYMACVFELCGAAVRAGPLRLQAKTEILESSRGVDCSGRQV
jgi:hypothetical protein